jgi:type III restriction enzyme
LLAEFSYDGADRVYRSIVSGAHGEKRLKPILRPYDPIGSTGLVSFDTTKAVYTTDPAKSHLNYVVLDSGWEAKLAEVLEAMPEVFCYVKNQGLGFTIPYTLEGKSRSYIPDFLVRFREGPDAGLTLILEVSGEAKKDKAAKVAAARALWVPAVNNHGGLGRWAFAEITDPWDAPGMIRAALVNELSAAGGR